MPVKDRYRYMGSLNFRLVGRSVKDILTDAIAHENVLC